MKSVPAARRWICPSATMWLSIGRTAARMVGVSDPVFFSMRAIAVTTSTRSALAPELPTLGETLGLEGYDLRAWTGMFGPAESLRLGHDTSSQLPRRMV